MKHRINLRRLGRPTGHRNCTIPYKLYYLCYNTIALFRNQVTSLIKHDKITTTVEKAKELRRFADKMVTLAKDGSLHARRQMLSFVYEKQMVQKAFEEFPKRFASRNGYVNA